LAIPDLLSVGVAMPVTRLGPGRAWAIRRNRIYRRGRVYGKGRYREIGTKR